MVGTKETLSEKWYTFLRYYCKEGTIDYWGGDSFHNPNSEVKPSLQLNSSTYYLRFNNGKWIHYREFESYMVIFEIRANFKEWSAEDLLTVLLKD